MYFYLKLIFKIQTKRMPKTREITDVERMAICTKRQAGATLQMLANEYNICLEGVRKVINKKENTRLVKNLPRSSGIGQQRTGRIGQLFALLKHIRIFLREKLKRGWIWMWPKRPSEIDCMKQICSGESPEISRILTSATEKSVWNLRESMWTSGKNFGVMFYELTSPALKCEVKTQKEKMFG